MAKWVKMLANAFSLCISTLDYLLSAAIDTPDSPVALTPLEECLGGKPSLLSVPPSEVIEGLSALFFYVC